MYLFLPMSPRNVLAEMAHALLEVLCVLPGRVRAPPRICARGIMQTMYSMGKERHHHPGRSCSRVRVATNILHSNHQPDTERSRVRIGYKHPARDVQHLAYRYLTSLRSWRRIPLNAAADAAFGFVSDPHTSLKYLG